MTNSVNSQQREVSESDFIELNPKKDQKLVVMCKSMSWIHKLPIDVNSYEYILYCSMENPAELTKVEVSEADFNIVTNLPFFLPLDGENAKFINASIITGYETNETKVFENNSDVQPKKIILTSRFYQSLNTTGHKLVSIPFQSTKIIKYFESNISNINKQSIKTKTA